MGSKRSSSKNPNKVPSPPPPAATPDDEIHKNPNNHKNPNLASPSKSRKKQKLSTPITHMSPDKSSLAPIPSTEVEAPSNHKDKFPSNSNEIAPSDVAANFHSSHHWGEDSTLKFLKALLAFRLKKRSLHKPSHMADLLTEINSWAPFQLTDKNVDSKYRHLRFKFHRSPKPGPESSEFDRTFYEIGTQVWGPVSLEVKDSAAGSMNENTLKENGILEKRGKRKREEEESSKKLNGEKQDVYVKEEDADAVEEEGSESEDDEGSDEKAEKSMEVENGEAHEKEDLLVGEDSCLLDRDVSGYPYKYLKLALEEYWTEAKLFMDTLYSALPNVNPVKAKRLDGQFLELFEAKLKLKMEKNKLYNDVTYAALSH